MKLKLIAYLVAIGNLMYSQSSCCGKPHSSETFAKLSKDKQFVSSHLEPLPFMLTNPAGKDISFKTPDGKEGYGYEIKNEKSTNKYVFVIHEWWGLNDYIKQEAEKIFTALGDVNVIALDLYDKKVATSRDSATKYMQSVTFQRAESIINGAIEHAGKKASIATIGWCFGGGWSMQSSILAGKQGKACVIYYGMPEEKTDRLKNLEAPVLMIWAEQDKWINKDVVTKFEENMKSLKKPLEVKKYNADHAFANPSNPKYSKEYADEAFTTSMDFIKKHLK
jgi:carboxymethylenebutenolidase